MSAARRRADELIVDGYNVIFRLEPGAATRTDEMRRCRAVLEAALAALGGRDGLRPRLVYDGERGMQGNLPARDEACLQVSYVEPPAEADDAIVQMARQLVQAGRAVTVVTSDRGLARRVQSAGGRVESVEAFQARLESGDGGREANDAAVVEGNDDLPAVDGMATVEATFLALHHRLEKIHAFEAEQDRRGKAGAIEDESAEAATRLNPVVPGAESQGQPGPVAGPELTRPASGAESSRPTDRQTSLSTASTEPSRGRRRQERRLQRLRAGTGSPKKRKRRR